MTGPIIMAPMRSDDERADNLFSRLFSYSPRLEREPIEDFCTEALAWCLRNSTDLPTKFLGLTNVKALTERIIPPASVRPQIDTQLRFRTTDEEKDDENETAGRFDLVIQSGLPLPFVLVVEAKVGSPFGTNQLERYRRELDSSDAFEGIPQDARHLVTLTILRQDRSRLKDGRPLPDGSITWAKVHRAISQSSGNEDALVSGILKQFAFFLKEKGLSMLELKKTDADLLNQWPKVKEFDEQLQQIVERLRNEKDIKPLVRKKVESEAEWIGVYGKNTICDESDFFAGFGILKMEGGSELFMQVEIIVPGDQRKLIKNLDSEMKAAFEEAKRFYKRINGDIVNFDKLMPDGSSCFVFDKQVTGEIAGDGEAVFEWLYRTAKKAIALAKPT